MFYCIEADEGKEEQGKQIIAQHAILFSLEIIYLILLNLIKKP